MEKGERIKGERSGRKGDGRRESRIPCPPFKLAPIWLDTLLINRYNEPIYFYQHKLALFSQRPHM